MKCSEPSPVIYFILMLAINEARRLKELERENSELKKMLAESLLKNRVLEAVCEKKL